MADNWGVRGRLAGLRRSSHGSRTVREGAAKTFWIAAASLLKFSCWRFPAALRAKVNTGGSAVGAKIYDVMSQKDRAMVPTSKTMKSLFARSGNRCAFPDCYVPLVEENDIVTGEVCHIKARNARGPRYDPSQTDEERNDSANLILLCARHHKIVDDAPAAYSAPVLCAMKKERESVGEITITPAIARRAELLRQSLIIKVVSFRQGCVTRFSFPC